MAIERDEVATMIIDALNVFESHTRGVRESENLDLRGAKDVSKAQSEERLIVSVSQHLRRQLSQGRKPRYGISIGESIAINTKLDPEITRVSVYSPYIGDSGTIWNWAEFDFPPNPTRFLEELVRGQNHGLMISTGFHHSEAGIIIDTVTLG